MTKITNIVVALTFCATSSLVSAEEVEQEMATEYTHSGELYPPVLFVTNIDGGFKDKLNSYQAFNRLDSEAVGLPIGVRVLKGHRTKQNATQFSSLMLSASTLGLIPVVSNSEFKVHYDIFVQGKSIAKFKYQVDSTKVNNLWAGPNQGQDTKPSEELFLQYTVPQFLTELQASEEVQAVFDEYRFYFGDSETNADTK